TLLNFQFNLLYGRHILLGILDKAAYPPPVDPRTATTPAPTRDQLRFRSTDGSWNNLEHPEIGRAGTPLGRYLPAVAATPQDVYREPSVLMVSERLLKQKQFIPAATSHGTINALAFARVNFFVHDFCARGTGFPRGAGGPLDLFCGAEGGGGPRGGPAVFLTGDSPRSSLHIGLLLFHHLWAHEHNYIVDQLQARYPAMTNEELYRTARLIVAAEIAKV